jgi:excinuclease UvrABC helicase subunit UvrB
LKKLTQGIETGERYQTLLGVGSGKITVTNVIEEVQNQP